MKQEYAKKIDQATQLLHDAVEILLTQVSPPWLFNKDDTEQKKLSSISDVYRDMGHWINHLDTPEMKGLVRMLNATRVLLYAKYMSGWDKE